MTYATEKVSHPHTIDVDLGSDDLLIVHVDLLLEVTPGEAATRNYPNSELGCPASMPSAALLGIHVRLVEQCSDRGQWADITRTDSPLLCQWLDSLLWETVDHNDLTDLYLYRNH